MQRMDIILCDVFDRHLQRIIPMLNYLFPLLSCTILFLATGCSKVTNNINDVALECGIEPEKAREEGDWIKFTNATDVVEVTSVASGLKLSLTPKNCLQKSKIEDNFPLIAKDSKSDRGLILDLSTLKQLAPDDLLTEVMLKEHNYKPITADCSVNDKNKIGLPLQGDISLNSYKLSWEVNNENAELVSRANDLLNADSELVIINRKFVGEGMYRANFKITELFSNNQDEFEFSCNYIVDRTSDDVVLN